MGGCYDPPYTLPEPLEPLATDALPEPLELLATDAPSDPFKLLTTDALSTLSELLTAGGVAIRPLPPDDMKKRRARYGHVFCLRDCRVSTVQAMHSITVQIVGSGVRTAFDLTVRASAAPDLCMWNGRGERVPLDPNAVVLCILFVQ